MTLSAGYGSDGVAHADLRSPRVRWSEGCYHLSGTTSEESATHACTTHKIFSNKNEGRFVTLLDCQKATGDSS
eukprot:scaffold516_cov270-Pinguiococcus_pyrenoidosus.AAC.13